METLLFALLMFAAVLVSAVVSQLVPKASAPLVQICLGLLIALVAGDHIELVFEDQQLFLTLFIAPLLYDEAKRIDKAALWRNILPVLSLAVGLVVAATVVVGFSVHALMPAIGLAAAFALGAALGPTDAVSVAALSSETEIDERSESILAGESLINDASGLVAFQFAIAVAAGGSFSLPDAIGSFLVAFLGGILIGLVLGWLGNFIVGKVRSWGLESTTFHVLFELSIPFIVYLVASLANVSGILAVVAAGLVDRISERTAEPAGSRINIVSTSVWQVLTFALNGVVFVLLGTQLPLAMRSTWEDVYISNASLIGCVLLITAILLACRFVWTLAMELVHGRWEPGSAGVHLRKVAVMTFAGPKGAVTIVVALGIPASIAQRDLIVFLACGVTVATLLLATFVVPVLCPSRKTGEEKESHKAQVQIDILRSVMETLAARQTDENREATQTVVQSYNKRVERIKDRNGIEESEGASQLRLRAIGWERDYVDARIKDGSVDSELGYRYLSRLAKTENLLLSSSPAAKLRNAGLRLEAWLRSFWHRLIKKVPKAETPEKSLEARVLQEDACEHVIEKLEWEYSSASPEKAEDVTAVLEEYRRTLHAAQVDYPSVDALAETEAKANEIRQEGLSLELEQIQQKSESGELSREEAQSLRKEVRLAMVELEGTV